MSLNFLSLSFPIHILSERVQKSYYKESFPNLFRILENKKVICSTTFDLLNMLLPLLLFSQAIVAFQKLQVIFLKKYFTQISKILIGLSPFHLSTGSEEHPWAYGWEKQLKKSPRSAMQKGREKYTYTSVTTAHGQMP